MADFEPNEIVVEKLVRKRSSVERAFVWAGIALLLVVVLVEWTSLTQYTASLASLDAAIRDRDKTTGHVIGIPLAEAERQIKGLPFRSEETFEIKWRSDEGEETIEIWRKVVFHWPSLFKRYKIGLTINGRGQAIDVDSLIPGGET